MFACHPLHCCVSIHYIVVFEAFGDSITDGTNTTLNGDGERFPTNYTHTHHTHMRNVICAHRTRAFTTLVHALSLRIDRWCDVLQRRLSLAHLKAPLRCPPFAVLVHMLSLFPSLSFQGYLSPPLYSKGPISLPLFIPKDLSLSPSLFQRTYLSSSLYSMGAYLSSSLYSKT